MCCAVCVKFYDAVLFAHHSTFDGYDDVRGTNKSVMMLQSWLSCTQFGEITLSPYICNVTSDHLSRKYTVQCTSLAYLFIYLNFCQYQSNVFAFFSLQLHKYCIISASNIHTSPNGSHNVLPQLDVSCWGGKKICENLTHFCYILDKLYNYNYESHYIWANIRLNFILFLLLRAGVPMAARKSLLT